MGRIDGFSGERVYNSMSFTPNEVKKNLHIKLIESLVDIAAELEDGFYDIHLTTDGYCFIVEWSYVPNDYSFGGTFEYKSFNDEDNLDDNK